MCDGVIQGFIAQINKIQDTIWKSQHFDEKQKEHFCWTFETMYTSAKLPSLIYTQNMKAIKDCLSLLSPKSGQSKETNTKNLQQKIWQPASPFLKVWNRTSVSGNSAPTAGKKKLLNLSQFNENSLLENVNINSSGSVDLRGEKEGCTCCDCLWH